MLAGLKPRADTVLFVTLTAPGTDAGLSNATAITTWNEGAAKRWHHFVLLLRRAFPGAQVEFFRVGEIQKRGAIHYHNAVAGIEFIPQDVLSRIAVRAGFGPIVDVRRLRHVGGGVMYFAKYMLKDADKWPPGRRVWSCSAKWRVAWENNWPAREGSRVEVVDVETGEVFELSAWLYDPLRRGRPPT